eukprot:957559-Pleurochrysis_carterae.AAC.1
MSCRNRFGAVRERSNDAGAALGFKFTAGLCPQGPAKPMAATVNHRLVVHVPSDRLKQHINSIYGSCCCCFHSCCH